MNARDRRALVIGALVVLPPLLATWGARPLGAFRALQDEVRRETDLLARERGLFADAPALDTAVRVLEAHLAQADTFLFPGADPLDATASLATYVADLARRHRVHVQQAETRGATPVSGGLVAVEAGMRASGDLEGMLAWLASIERGPRLVGVTRLGIERTSGPSSDPDRETLSITIVVRGFTAAVVAGVP